MRSRFTEVEQNLRSVLDQKLLTHLYSFREKRLSRIKNIIDSITDTLPASSGSGNEPLQKAIQKGTDQLKLFLQREQDSAIQDVIIDDIFAVKNQLPRREVLRNVPERFRLLEEDNFFVKGGKTVKKLIRNWGKTEWLQRIPLQEVVAYHLLDAQWFYKEWITAEERLNMQIILELNDVLAQALQTKKKSDQLTELKQSLKVVRNHIGEAKRLHKQKLVEARDTFIDQFMTVFVRVGTFERRNTFYSDKRLQQKRSQTKKDLDGYIGKWQQNNMRLLKQTEIRHQFLVYCDGFEKMTKMLKAQLHDAFDQLYVSPYQALRKRIRNVNVQIKNAGADLASVLASGERSLVNYIEQSLLEQLRQSTDESATEHEVELYSQQLIERTAKLPESCVLITHTDRSEDPPDVNAIEVDLKSNVRESLRTLILERITPDDKAMGDFKQQLLDEAQEIEEIIAVNFELALEFIQHRDTEENPQKIADQALQQVLSKVETCLSEIDKKKSALLDPLEEGNRAFRQSVFDLLCHTDDAKQQPAGPKEKIKERTRNLSKRIQAQWAHVQKRAAVIRRFAGAKAKKYYRKITGVLNLKSNGLQKKEKTDVGAYLREIEKRREALPPIYQRLFDFKTKANERHYVGLNELVSEVREAYEHQHRGAPAIAVVGEKGSGKSALFDLAADKLFKTKRMWRLTSKKKVWTIHDLLALFSMQLGEVNFSSIEELTAFLKQKRGPEIILIDDIQCFYLRHLNGYEAIEQLIYLMSETSENVFWMISCSRYPWNFLDKVADLNEYALQVIRTDDLDDEQIRDVILKRHHSSGYELIFEPAESTAKSKKYSRINDDEEKQEHLKKDFFGDLTDLAEGNASVAITFWIRSIRDFDDTHLYITPFEAALLNTLSDLQPETLFVLMSFILHDTLTPKELSVILHMKEKESKLCFNRLKAKDILVEETNGVSLNQLMYRQTIRELKKRNILHLE